MSSSNLEKYRSMYESLVYRSWSAEKAGNDLLMRFQIELVSNVPEQESFTFFPELKFHDMADAFFALPELEQTSIGFNLGLAELPSYWKAACPQNITITATHAYSKSQTNQLLKWWHSLFIFGMSEFYFVNDIAEFANAGFISWNMSTHDSNQEYCEYMGEDLPSLNQYMEEIVTKGSKQSKNLKSQFSTLIPVGGGKDSAVVLSFFESLLRDQNPEVFESSNKKISDVKILLLDATAASERSAKEAGFESLKISRKIDPTLISLNQQGFLNGHTPFSAYLAFVSYAVAHIQNISEIALSNEHSADEGNTWFHGLDINHQYSKTTQFEKSFQWYSESFLPGDAYYYSLLRPLYEIQIGSIFSSTKYTHSFLSCNVGGKKDYWCRNCPKCLFAFTLLYPHFLKQSLDEIGLAKKSADPTSNHQDNLYEQIQQKMAEKSPLFEIDLFAQESQITLLQDLLGVGPHKPLECVGLYQETLLSAWRSVQLLDSMVEQLPLLEWFKTEILPQHDQKKLEAEWQQMLHHWNTNHTLPNWIEPLFHALVQQNTWVDQDELIEQKSIQKVLLLGLGNEALSSYEYLQKSDNYSNNLEIWIADETPLEKLNPFWKQAVESKKIAGFILLPIQFGKNFDVIVKSPGIPLHKLKQIYNLHAPSITSNTQLFFEEIQEIRRSHNNVGITTIGVTGTKGKSTTSAVIHAALSEAAPQGATVLLGGNIGTPPLDLLKQIKKDTSDQNKKFIDGDYILVLELSCHQLAELTISPQIAVVQKITPEHLDYYRSMAEYVESKTSICKHQKSSDTVFYFDDGAFTSQVGQQGAGEKIPFTLQNMYSLEEKVGKVLVRDSFDTEHPDVRLKLAGRHNLINVLPALLVAEKFEFDVVRAASAARTFPGLPYRLQSIGSATISTQSDTTTATENVLHFYNDSLATTPESAAAAISSFPTNTVHLIAGGHERNLSFKPLAQTVIQQQVKTLFLFPPTGTRIEQAVLEEFKSQNHDQPLPVMIHVTSMTEVFSHIAKLSHLKTNDFILLSPAAPSFGVFKDYKDRGDQFLEHFLKIHQ